MIRNIGTFDKYIRLLLGLLLLFLAWKGFIQGAGAIAAGVVALILVLTSWANFCPVYLVLGWNTVGKYKK